VDAVRTQHLARRFPLSPGDRAWVGLRRVHALAHPGMAFVVVHDAASTDSTALDRAASLARRARARLTLLAYGAAEPAAEQALGAARVRAATAQVPVTVQRSPDDAARALRAHAPTGAFDLVVTGRGSGAATELPGEALRHGDHHVLVVPPGAVEPRRVLIGVAHGEPGKRGIRFAGRLARHLQAEVTVLTVLPADSDLGPTSEQAERFLAACARTLAPLGIQAATRLRRGDPEDEIRAECSEGGHDLLVVGVPLGRRGAPPKLDGPVAGLLKTAAIPLLIVRTTGEEA
jgi:nucleotide-binding universal stress UspA family protein